MTATKPMRLPQLERVSAPLEQHQESVTEGFEVRKRLPRKTAAVFASSQTTKNSWPC